LDASLIDEILQVTNEEAMAMARQAARQEGLFIGISSGAALHATIQVARRPEMVGRMILTIIPSFGERYLSSDLFKEYLD
jgi:cysteine synthase A